jgi:PBP1b-binding outer membrane lipoprotein LpoB
MKKNIVVIILLSFMFLQGCATAIVYYPDGKIYKKATGLFNVEMALDPDELKSKN